MRLADELRAASAGLARATAELAHAHRGLRTAWRWLVTLLVLAAALAALVWLWGVR